MSGAVPPLNAPAARTDAPETRSGAARFEFNRHGVWAIYKFEIARGMRTLVQTLVTPAITTSLYFVVFGAAIGARMTAVSGVSYGAFIVPGLIMLALFTESLANASFGIFFPKFVGTIYELLSAPISYAEIVIAYVGAAATKSVVLGFVILATASLFVSLKIAHPVLMIAFLLMTAINFSLFGFILGLWARGWEQLQLIPALVVTPLTFLGGAFYSISMLPPAWRAFSLFNPVVYLISGFRWCFYGTADVNVGISFAMMLAFFAACLTAVGWIFKTGYRLKN
jgi:ABC-2 type transport system permease protein